MGGIHTTTTSMGFLKRIARGSATAMVAICMVPVSLHAQETGTLIQRKAAQIDGRTKEAARKTVDAFAECLVSRSPGRVAKLADLAVDTPAYDKQYRSLFKTMGDECLSDGQLGFSALIIRGALYSALYNREFKLNPPLAFDPAINTGNRALYSEPYSDAARSAIALNNMGECVARADAANVRALLGSVPGSDFEDQTFRTLLPKISGCITKDNKITFSKVILKGVLAEGLYRLSVAHRTQVVVK